jgi:hypothetical protein
MRTTTCISIALCGVLALLPLDAARAGAGQSAYPHRRLPAPDPRHQADYGLAL